ncbi:MAG: ribosome biogenesis GTPase Der [Chitinophagaceae bacterium]
MSKYTVAIVGRPNVGKSTLFNRLTESRNAIVDNISGVTRDRIYGESEWNGKEFNVMDTGGFVKHTHDVFELGIQQQVQLAFKETDAILFLVDATTGITHLDAELADMLRSIKKAVYVVVNKVDNSDRMLQATEFYGMGFKYLFFIAAISGSGTGELLDEIVKKIPIKQEAVDSEEIPKIAIIGQPNVGKSTLLNALVGEDRVLVTDIAGTTRDAIHIRYNLFHKNFILIDTAGLRRKDRTKEDLEFYSVIRAVRVIDEANVCLLLVDAEKGFVSQDLKIFSLATRKYRGIIILVNKWDLKEKDNHTAKAMEKEIKNKIAPFTDVPIVFISALEKTRIFKAIEEALAIAERKKLKISTSSLNQWLEKAITEFPPPTHRGQSISIKFITQIHSSVPSFSLFCNHPESVSNSYKNYLENSLRKTYMLTGVPIRLFFKKK